MGTVKNHDNYLEKIRHYDCCIIVIVQSNEEFNNTNYKTDALKTFKF